MCFSAIMAFNTKQEGGVDQNHMNATALRIC